MSLRKEDRLKLILFLLPAIILFIALFIYPLVYVVVMSFFKWDAFSSPIFVGFQNYVTMFKDAIFKTSVKNNVIWAVLDVLVKVPLSLIMALILAKQFKGWKIFRTVYFLPQIISGIAMAALWKAVYNYDYGVLNGITKLFGMEKINWLGDTKYALGCVIIYGLLYVGYFMVIMMAEITSVDKTYFEAAALDGANSLQTDWHITIPMIRSSLSTCITLAAVFGLRAFEQVYLITAGGPANSTMTLVMYIYKKMNSNIYGVGNAAAVMLVLLGITVMTAIRKLLEERNR